MSRVPLDTTIRNEAGRLVSGLDLYALTRGDPTRADAVDGSDPAEVAAFVGGETEIDVYAARTGGSPLTQPLESYSEDSDFYWVDPVSVDKYVPRDEKNPITPVEGAKGGAAPGAAWIPGKIEAFPRAAAASALVLASGTLHLTALSEPLRAGVAYTTITFVSSAAGVTLTNQWFCLVRKSDRAILRSTANDGATAWAAQTAKTLALSSSYTPGSDTDVYLGIMVTATTPPSISRSQPNVGLVGLAPILAGTADAGLTVPLADDTVTAALTAIQSILWGAVT